MLEKAYQPGEVEKKWLEQWQQSGLFKPEPSSRRKFSIVIPPPNVTGALHMGHALNNTIQDVLIRWHKLSGEDTCWAFGTDHGGIATQNVMEKQLKVRKTSRQELGRVEFLKSMQSWVYECKKIITSQLHRLGCALDFEHEAFTMDGPRAEAVFHTFKSLWDKKLIYRGERMVNWCVRCETAISDLEVEHEERKGQLWHIRYPLVEGQGALIVATTRPETLLGDTAVAVNPQDNRFAAHRGRKVRRPLIGGEIPIVFDESVDSAFGTGALKVTPAHDPNDFEIAQRHHLTAIKVIDINGKMTAEAGRYANLSREEAREKIVEDLKASGLLEKIEDYRHSVGICYRCSQVIEPLLSWQWFVQMTGLAKPAIEAAEKGLFRIHPSSWTKPYLDWLKQMRDWCISRQIWWGHRIPVWYCVACNDGKIHWMKEASEKIPSLILDAKVAAVSLSKPQRCPDCGSNDLIQDPDVLDTWFSSALWPMSVFGWPQKTPYLDAYYPTSVLVTGYEILYLWVARMQMMGIEFMGKPPFAEAIIHGIVRDKSGKKMSKSLGNVVDPLELMEKHGTDALRFSLLLQARPGKDIPFSEDSTIGSVHFTNKIWNSVRFVLMNLPETAPGAYPLSKLSHCCLELADRWILAEYQKTIELVKEKMGAHEIAQAADVLYEFLWDKFCDWYVELAKIRLQGIDGEEKESARTILVQVLNGTLKSLHPFMPFITEELFKELKPFSGDKADFVIKSGLPELSFDWSNEQALEEMKVIMEAVRSIRSLRSQLNLSPGLKITVNIAMSSSPALEVLKRQENYLKVLARIGEISYIEAKDKPKHSVAAVACGISLFISLEGVVDFEKEKERLRKEIEKTLSELQKISRKVENKDFLARAPKEEIDLARFQHETVLERKKRLEEIVSALT